MTDGIKGSNTGMLSGGSSGLGAKSVGRSRLKGALVRTNMGAGTLGVFTGDAGVETVGAEGAMGAVPKGELGPTDTGGETGVEGAVGESPFAGAEAGADGAEGADGALGMAAGAAGELGVPASVAVGADGALGVSAGADGALGEPAGADGALGEPAGADGALPAGAAGVMGAAAMGGNGAMGAPAVMGGATGAAVGAVLYRLQQRGMGRPLAISRRQNFLPRFVLHRNAIVGAWQTSKTISAKTIIRVDEYIMLVEEWGRYCCQFVWHHAEWKKVNCMDAVMLMVKIGAIEKIRSAFNCRVKYDFGLQRPTSCWYL
jgi:hypothetical protein